MKLLNCTICGDLIAVTPVERRCFCGKSKAKFSFDVHKEVYSGPAILIGIKDDEVLNLKDNLDENGFFKSTWVTILPTASTILKVKDVSTWKPKKLRRRLTGRRTGA